MEKISEVPKLPMPKTTHSRLSNCKNKTENDHKGRKGGQLA